jgi:hypothetical protein
MTSLEAKPETTRGRVMYKSLLSVHASFAATSTSSKRSRHRPSMASPQSAVDAQYTFCIPGLELFVAGRSGAGADDRYRPSGSDHA